MERLKKGQRVQHADRKNRAPTHSQEGENKPVMESIHCQSESLAGASRNALVNESNAVESSEESASLGNQADTEEQLQFIPLDVTDKTQTILNVYVDGEDSGYAICGELYQGHWRFWKETLLSDTALEMLLDNDDTTFLSLLEELTSEPDRVYVETLDDALELLNPLWPKLYLFAIHPDFSKDIWLRALAYWSNANFVDPNIVSWWSQYCLGNEITSIDELAPFPWDLPAHWHNFANALRKTLAHMAQDQYLILQCKGSNRFVQFATQHKDFRIEASSDHYLSGRDALSEKDIQVLLQLGWKEPTGTPEQSTPERDPDGSSNFFLELPLNNNFTRLTTLAIKTLSEVMGVPHVEYLAYNAFGVSGGDVSYPELGIKREVLEPTVQMEELARRLLDALREISGCATLTFNADGDVDVTIEGQIYLIRLIGKSLMEHPMIRFHVPLLVEIDLDQQLLVQLNQLNLRGAPVRHVWIDNMVWGMLDIPAWPLKVQHIETSLSLFADVASRSALWLASEIETPASSLRH